LKGKELASSANLSGLEEEASSRQWENKHRSTYLYLKVLYTKSDLKSREKNEGVKMASGPG
jgi:hypothetical protein